MTNLISAFIGVQGELIILAREDKAKERRIVTNIKLKENSKEHEKNTKEFKKKYLIIILYLCLCKST